MRASRGVRAFAGLVGSLFLLSGCAVGGTRIIGTAVPMPSAPVPVTTVSVLVPADRDGTGAAWDRVVAGFTEAHPEIRIALEARPRPTLDDLVRVRLQSPRTAPDILGLDTVGGFAAAGMLSPAAEVVSPGVLNDFAPAYAAHAGLGPVRFGLPLSATPRALFYNQSLFERAGLVDPPRTWADLATAADVISGLGGGLAGYGMPLAGADAVDEVSTWTYGAGGAWSDGARITVNTPDNVAGLTAMRRLIAARGTQTDLATLDRARLTDRFAQGRIGMIEGTPATIAQLAAADPGLRYGVTPPPTRDGAPATPATVEHLMVFRNDGSKLAAVRTFLDYLYTPAVYAEFIRAQGLVPVTGSGVAALGDDPIVRSFAPTLPGARFAPIDNPRWRAARDELNRRAVDIASTGPAELLADVQRAVDGQN